MIRYTLAIPTLLLGGLLAMPQPAAGITLHVSPQGADGNSGDDWGHPLATISNALARAVSNDTILVSNGLYEVELQITIDKAVTLTALGGADETIVRNTAATGRVFHIDHPAAILDGFTVTGGDAPADDRRGGGILLSAGTVRNCDIRDNISVRNKDYKDPGSRGAGVYVVSGLLTNSVVQRNQTYQNRAAGVYMAGGVMADCRIIANGSSDAYQRATYGAGVCLEAGSLAVDCLIAGNLGTASTYHRGGGVYLDGGTLRRSRVVSNEVAGISSGGGGMWLDSGLVESCLIAFNKCSTRNSLGGGGVAIAGGVLSNCTVVENKISQFGDATIAYDAAGVLWRGGTVSNTIIRHNTRQGSQTGILNVGGDAGYAAAFISCNAPDLEAGVNGNFPDDPLFVNRAAGDFRLRADSPCVDVGTDSGAATDLLGALRPSDGDGDGLAVHDVGAFERADANAAFNCFFTVDVPEAFHAATVTFEAQVFGPDTSGLYYYWDFGNGQQEGDNQSSVVRQFTTGFYDVTLTVSNALGETARWSLAEAVRIGAPVVYVAPAGRHIKPFDTWSKAATNILEGVKAAVVVPEASSLVLVSNGWYDISSASQSIVLDRAITVASLSGPSETVVSGTYLTEVYPNFDIGHPGAVVEGFTSRNANFGVMVHRGTMRDCVLSDNNGHNSRGDNSGFGAGAMLFGGLLSRCRVVGNHIDGTTALRGGGIYMTGPSRVEYSFVASNTVAPRMSSAGGGIATEDYSNRPVIRNCLITGNAIKYIHSSLFGNGGGIMLGGGRVENSTIANNTAEVLAGPCGAGLHVTAGEVVNTIVYGNRNIKLDIDDDLRWSTSMDESLASHSCAPELTTEVQGNRADDPMFIDLVGVNYRLRDGSPAINSGMPLAWMKAAATDFDGRPRVMAGRVDMGAFEWMPPGGTFLIIR